MRRVLLFCFLLCVTFFFMFGKILRDEEMHISLQKGDWLLILPIKPKIGDAILIEDPFVSGRTHVRRLIATSGMDITYERNGTIVRDNRRITQKDMGNVKQSRVIEEKEWLGGEHARKRYIFRRQRPVALSFAKQTINERSVYVLSDNRDSGLDSRYWGSISEEGILGVVCLRIGSSTPWSGWLTWYP